MVSSRGVGGFLEWYSPVSDRDAHTPWRIFLTCINPKQDQHFCQHVQFQIWCLKITKKKRKTGKRRRKRMKQKKTKIIDCDMTRREWLKQNWVDGKLRNWRHLNTYEFLAWIIDMHVLTWLCLRRDCVSRSTPQWEWEEGKAKGVDVLGSDGVVCLRWRGNDNAERAMREDTKRGRREWDGGKKWTRLTEWVTR